MQKLKQKIEQLRKAYKKASALENEIGALLNERYTDFEAQIQFTTGDGVTILNVETANLATAHDCLEIIRDTGRLSAHKFEHITF
jgi:hypothetical protein